MDLQLEQDIKFLLSFVPCDSPDDVPEGLNPMFYFTGTCEGDREIARKISDIRSRYNVDQESTDTDE